MLKKTKIEKLENVSVSSNSKIYNPIINDDEIDNLQTINKYNGKNFTCIFIDFTFIFLTHHYLRLLLLYPFVY